jgi:putative transcriptional regulator
MSNGSLQGRLLVANPRLPDPNFDRTVVLMLAHSDDGALGVVLNRPLETAVSEALPGWEEVASPPTVLFAGGPVEPAAAICLARRTGARSPAPEGGEWWKAVSGAVGTLDLDTEPESAGAAVDGLRVFAGYAGWGPGQLEAEIESGGWFVVDARDGDAFSTQPDHLWKSVLRRQRGSLALVAAYPADPAMN